MKKNKLEKRQAKYKIGSIVQIKDALPYWSLPYRYRRDNEYAEIIEKDLPSYKSKRYWVRIRTLREPHEECWAIKSRHIRLVSKNKALMEKL